MSDFRDQDYRRKGALNNRIVAQDEERAQKARDLIVKLNRVDALQWMSDEEKAKARRVILSGEKR